MMHKKSVLLLAVSALAACSSMKEAMRPKQAPESLVHLTLLPRDKPTPQSPTPVQAKITFLKSRALVTHADLVKGTPDALPLYAIDSGFVDYQPISAAATDTDGLYSFTFTPHTTNSYRLWAETPLAQEALPEHPFADIGARSPGQFPRTESLTTQSNGRSYTLAFSDPLKRYDDIALTVTSNGVSLPIHEVVGFYSDYRNLLHNRFAPGKKPEIMPLQEGFIRLFITVDDNGGERILPFTALIQNDK